MEKLITTVFYRNSESIVICSLSLSQKIGNTVPSLQILSPDSIVNESMFGITSQNTSHQIVVHSVKNGSYVDYINSIAMCFIKARIPCDVLTAASIGDNSMVYSITKNVVIRACIVDTHDSSMVDRLVDESIRKYNELMNMNYN